MAKKQASPHKPTSKSGPTPQQAESNPFDFQAPEVDKELYGAERVSYPAIIWMSRFDGNEEKSRPWVIDRENVSTMPQPFWREENVRFGGEPNEPYTPVYMTEVNRCVPLGIRMRQIVEDSNGTLHYHHIYTKRENRTPGKLSFHYQIMVSLPGLPHDELAILALRGYTRTMSWKHNGKRNRNFPVGVEDQLREYADRASRTVGGDMPIWCAWAIDLRGVYNEGKPHYIAVGPNDGTWVQPFGIDLRTSKEPRKGDPYNEDGSLKFDSNGLPWTRYVGPIMFNKYQELYHNVVKDWVDKWSPENMGKHIDVEADKNNEKQGYDPIGDEEDEIPF